MTQRTLIAGIGNIFLGDDGFGVEVANRMATTPLPDGVRAVDYGIRGMHLAYDLASGYDRAILVDATSRGGTPGTIYVIEPEPGPRDEPGQDDPALDSLAPDSSVLAPVPSDRAAAGNPVFDAHGMQPEVVLRMLDMLDGGRPDQILVVGCEPASIDYGIGLSEPVAAAVDEALRVVLGLVVPGARECDDRQDQTADAGGSPGPSSLPGLSAPRAARAQRGGTHVPRYPG